MIPMHPRRKKIIAFACITRLAIVIVQFVANIAIPDHNADVFLYPKENITSSLADKTVNTFLNGFVRWDAQYFMHVAKYGYTYENTLAFFPLYPLIAKTIATLISNVLVFLSEDCILLVTFVVLNVVFFVKATLILYDLSVVIVGEDLAYKTAIFYCINPATIFFVAPYTESLFSYLSFKSMLNCILIYGKHSIQSSIRLNFKSIISIILPIGLSACARSNGILNIGFISYFIIQWYVKSLKTQKALSSRIRYSIKNLILLVITVCLCLVPFGLVQAYDYLIFCKDFKHSLPDFIVDYGKTKEFVLPGMVSEHKQSWCFKQIPLAYSYIQEHYWNVGFLKYFELKQIPNFLLALPIITFVIGNSWRFLIAHTEYCLNLGIFKFKFKKLSSFIKYTNTGSYNPEMFVFVVHAVFLTLFCTFFIHVQVTTRMICSASPVVYWFAAYCFETVKEKDGKLQNVFLFDRHKTNQQQYIVYYFLTYCFVGTVLFSNFLPWT